MDDETLARWVELARKYSSGGDSVSAVAALADRIHELERAVETSRAEHAHGMLALDDYEAANLRAGLEVLRRLGCDTGDWLGQVMFRIPETSKAPNITPDSQVATSRAEHAAALGLATTRIRELEGEREELLGLLANDALWGSGCFAPFAGLVVDDVKCINDPPCWEHRRRAIVARIEKAAKGTT